MKTVSHSVNQSKINPAFVIVGAIVVIALAAFFLFRQITSPGETIKRYEDVPPKGAGKLDR
jgi:hypothetical protein